METTAPTRRRPTTTPPRRRGAGHEVEAQGPGERSWWSRGLGWLRGAATAAAGWLSSVIKPLGAQLKPLMRIKSPLRLAWSLFMATIGKDKGFGFWWLVVTLAIALVIGLLVTILLFPVIGLLSALIVGVWMLARRSGSSQSADEPKKTPRASDPAALPAR